MKSNFTHEIESLKRINGNSPNDYAIAETAVAEVQDFIAERVSILREYSDLKRILTSESLAEIESLMVSIRHVVSVFQEVCAFHRRGLLNDVFDVAHHNASMEVDGAEALVVRLKGLIKV